MEMKITELKGKVDFSNAIANYEINHFHDDLMIDLEAVLTHSKELSQNEKDSVIDELRGIEQEAQKKGLTRQFDSTIISLIK